MPGEADDEAHHTFVAQHVIAAASVPPSSQTAVEHPLRKVLVGDVESNAASFP